MRYITCIHRLATSEEDCKQQRNALFTMHGTIVAPSAALSQS